MIDPNSPPTAPVTPAPNTSAAPGSPPSALTAPPGTALELAQRLNAGTITINDAAKLSKAANLSMLDIARASSTLRTMEAEPKAETRTPAEQEADRQFGLPARPEEFTVRHYMPGREPAVMPKEVRDFDANVRGWMSDAGLPKNLGDSLASTLSKAIERTRMMTVEEREVYRDSENAKLEKLFGPDWHETKLPPVRVMLDQLELKRPGLRALIREHGDHATFLAQLIQAAKIYHSRAAAKGR